jgi:hypothetical protein
VRLSLVKHTVQNCKLNERSPSPRSGTLPLGERVGRFCEQHRADIGRGMRNSAQLQEEITMILLEEGL